MVLKISDFGEWQSPEERWADLIRVKDDLIKWPFTRDIVKGALRYFGSHNRPLLPYVFYDHEYDQIVVAEDTGDGYKFYDSDGEYHIPQIGSWREFAEWRGEAIEDLAAEWELDDDQWDEPLGMGVLEEHLPYDVSPYGRAYDTLSEVFCTPASVELPIGELGMHCGNETFACVQPKVALTFLQILLDYEETGIKIVLEENGGGTD
jgi:hypothetical protein